MSDRDTPSEDLLGLADRLDGLSLDSRRRQPPDVWRRRYVRALCQLRRWHLIGSPSDVDGGTADFVVIQSADERRLVNKIPT